MRILKSKRAVATALALTGTALVSGCFGPTYGTGVPAGSQLMNDIGESFSLGKKNQGAPINYSPRPDIVTPADTATLPTPQENIVDSSGQWPETPEQRRQRILADIEEGNRNPNFVVNKDQAAALGASEGPGRATAPRVFLTDPPSEYRQPAQTAEYGDLGETEAAKARAAKAEQGKQGGLRRLIPWL